MSLIDQSRPRLKPKSVSSPFCVVNEVWVDSSNDLASSENRIQFALKTGTAVHPELVGKVKEHGNQAFSFAVLEVFDGELSQYELDKLRKSRRQFWIEKLSARSLFR